jgi:hypothetical protein
MSDLVRETIRQGLAGKGRSMRWLSLKLGQNPAYIHQFLERGTPRDLDLQDVIECARLLNVPLQNFGITDVDLRAKDNQPRSAFEEDAVEFDLPNGSILTTSENISYVRMTSDALTSHPLRIEHGDVLAFDLSKAAVENIKSEAVVLLRCYPHDPNIAVGVTLVREFIRPSLITTNRPANNLVFSIDDPALPFETHIRGVLRNVVRNG